MKGIFDTHAHYFDRRYDEEAEGGADAVLKDIFPDPVSHIVNVGTNPQNSRLAVEQAARYPGMYAAVGIHPEDCHYLNDPEAALALISGMVSDPSRRASDKIVAIGEIGLDYHYENYGEIPLDKKKEAFFFDAQMELAKKVGLPVIVHDREAHGDCFETVLRHPGVRGVFHSYSGSPELAKELVRRGWYLSFSGSLTFKNANRVREAALAVPPEFLLVETDAPYLAPVPHRGELNHSGNLTFTLEVLAHLWNCSLEDAVCKTAENAAKFFLIP